MSSLHINNVNSNNTDNYYKIANSVFLNENDLNLNNQNKSNIKTVNQNYESSSTLFKDADPSDIARCLTRLTGTTFAFTSYDKIQSSTYIFDQVFRSANKYYYRLVFNLFTDKWTIFKIKDNEFEKVHESDFNDVIFKFA